MKDGDGSREFLFSEVVPLTTNIDRSGVPKFDASEFCEYVDDFDITEEQKNELLCALWSIAVAFVDLGFGVESIQRVIPALAEFSSHEESGEVQNSNPAQQFSSAAKNEMAEKDDSTWK